MTFALSTVSLSRRHFFGFLDDMAVSSTCIRLRNVTCLRRRHFFFCFSTDDVALLDDFPSAFATAVHLYGRHGLLDDVHPPSRRYISTTRHFFFFFDDFHPPWRRHVFATIWFHFFDMISPPRPTDDIYVAGAAAADRVHGDANRHCFSRCNCRPASPGPVQAVRLHLRVPVSGDA